MNGFGIRIRVCCLSLLILGALPLKVWSAPIDQYQEEAARQKMVIKVQRVGGTKRLLKNAFKAKIAEAVKWDYLPESFVSVPFLTLKLEGLPSDGVDVLFFKSQKMPIKNGSVPIRIPLLNQSNQVPVTLRERSGGGVEEWEIRIRLELKQSAVYVDENCQGYRLKIVERQRPSGHPNLMYVGCRPGSSPHHLSLDVFWGDVSRVIFQKKTTPVTKTVLTLPLHHRKRTRAALTGYDEDQKKNVFAIYYDPRFANTFEAWMGLAYFQNSFSNSNLSYQFKQSSTAFIGRIYFKPEGSPLSLLARGFGSLLSVSNKTVPDQANGESVSTYFLNLDLRMRLYSNRGWRLTPFLGGWLFMMRVKTKAFGLQRTVTPSFGVELAKTIASHDRLDLSFRLSPLHNFSSPFGFTLDEMYWEAGVTYSHGFRQGGRVFGVLTYSRLKFARAGQAAENGNYFVLGAGYGF